MIIYWTGILTTYKHLINTSNTNPTNTMTKAQKAALNAINNFLRNDKPTLSWSEIVDAVKESNPNVKNWMTVRTVLQSCINMQLIQRTNNIFTEEYQKS